MTAPRVPLQEVTPIPEALAGLFQAWVKRNRIRDLDAPDSFYDYRGAFLAGLNRGRDGHWPDTFKQHGHPTFSVESRYALPNDPLAGHWEGATYVPPVARRGLLTSEGPAHSPGIGAGLLGRYTPL